MICYMFISCLAPKTQIRIFMQNVYVPSMKIPFLKYPPRFFQNSFLVILAFARLTQESYKMPIRWPKSLIRGYSTRLTFSCIEEENFLWEIKVMWKCVIDVLLPWKDASLYSLFISWLISFLKGSYSNYIIFLLFKLNFTYSEYF